MNTEQPIGSDQQGLVSARRRSAARWELKSRVALTLGDANRMLHLYAEGIRRSQEALEIYERFGDAEGQGKCWTYLGWLFLGDGQLGAAEEAGSHAIKLFQGQGRDYWVCLSHRLLGDICRTKGEIGTAIRHFEKAIRIASPFEWHHELFWNHVSLAQLFRDEREFDSAQSHIERAKPHAVDDAYKLCRVMRLQARVWYHQGRLEEGKAEILCALKTFEELGATAELPLSRSLLWKIEQAIERR